MKKTPDELATQILAPLQDLLGSAIPIFMAFVLVVWVTVIFVQTDSKTPVRRSAVLGAQCASVLAILIFFVGAANLKIPEGAEPWGNPALWDCVVGAGAWGFVAVVAATVILRVSGLEDLEHRDD